MPRDDYERNGSKCSKELNGCPSVRRMDSENSLRRAPHSLILDNLQQAGIDWWREEVHGVSYPPLYSICAPERRGFCLAKRYAPVKFFPETPETRHAIALI
jgi:hypothetical protein